MKVIVTAIRFLAVTILYFGSFVVVSGALLWAALAVPIISLMKGRWWEAGLAVALLFAVVTAQLLIPNPLMPAEVRMTHLVETASSNFLFGWLVVLILRGRN
ncbi:MAG TPA: hypothetical protein VLB87_13255 [Pyrinomonadaceae bacterium]|nr:hypothetical protein [Pyrinomonadaceae bacterium]